MLDNNIFNESRALKLVAGGDQDTFTLLYERYQNKVFYHALAYVKSYDVAQEITQDIFLKIWTNRERLTKVDAFEDYLFILSRNQIIDAMRRRVNKPVKAFDLELAEDIAGTMHSLEQKELGAFIRGGIEQLPLRQQEVFILTYQEGFSYEEVGQQLGITKNTVKFHLVSALNFLRQYIRKAGYALLVIIFFIIFLKTPYPFFKKAASLCIERLHPLSAK